MNVSTELQWEYLSTFYVPNTGFLCVLCQKEKMASQMFVYLQIY